MTSRCTNCGRWKWASHRCPEYLYRVAPAGQCGSWSPVPGQEWTVFIWCPACGQVGQYPVNNWGVIDRRCEHCRQHIVRLLAEWHRPETRIVRDKPTRRRRRR